MDLNALARSYRGRRVLVTGHTGFKGSWLALWLGEMGAKVSGLALAPPTEPNHWNLLNLDVADHRADIRDARNVERVFADARPEIVFHLAAQPLVRRSYADPLGTWTTNVVGTANVLDACRRAPDLRAVVVVTSDKCYANDGKRRRYREIDPLGGHDPYSASKAAAELVAKSYRDAFFGNARAPLIAAARGGNVVGGGDWAEDRLIPDLVRAQSANASLAVRSPDATRPWQHVLDCLCGYLQLGAKLLAGDRECADAWNFGPSADDERSVSEVLAAMQKHWPGIRWHVDGAPRPPEAAVLALDTTKARAELDWQPAWSLDEALAKTALWYRRFLTDGIVESRRQLAEYAAALSERSLATAP